MLVSFYILNLFKQKSAERLCYISNPLCVEKIPYLIKLMNKLTCEKVYIVFKSE